MAAHNRINLQAPKPPKLQDSGKTALPAPPAPTTGGFGALADVAPPRPARSRVGGSGALPERGAPARPPALDTRTPEQRRGPEPTRIGDFSTDIATPPLTPTPNPFRGTARSDFDPANNAPTTVTEANQTSRWLQLPENAVFVATDELTGTLTATGSFGTRPATAEDVARADRNAALSVEIANVRTAALQFDNQQAESAINVSEEAAVAEIDATFALQEAELEKAVGLDPDLNKQRRLELQAEQQRALELIKARGQDERETAQATFTAQSAVIDKQFDNTVQLEAMRQSFSREQSELDRALRRDEFESAQTSARALEELDRSRLELEQQQFKLDIFAQLMESPQILAFLGEDGIEQFGDLLGDGGATIREMMQRVSAGGPAANIQGFARLSGEEQDTEAFRISALTGTAPGDIGQSLQNAAPTQAFQAGGLNRIRLGR